MPPDGRRIALGPVAAIPDASCVAVADGRVVVARVGERVVAYRNRCLHQDSPLTGGWIRDGVLSCPLHFWRYRIDDGSLVGSDTALERFDVEIAGDDAFVIVPDEPEPVSLREQLLARARSYDRDEAYQRETQRMHPPD